MADKNPRDRAGVAVNGVTGTVIMNVAKAHEQWRPGFDEQCVRRTASRHGVIDSGWPR